MKTYFETYKKLLKPRENLPKTFGNPDLLT